MGERMKESDRNIFVLIMIVMIILAFFTGTICGEIKMVNNIQRSLSGITIESVELNFNETKMVDYIYEKVYTENTNDKKVKE